MDLKREWPRLVLAVLFLIGAVITLIAMIRLMTISGSVFDIPENVGNDYHTEWRHHRAWASWGHHGGFLSRALLFALFIFFLGKGVAIAMAMHASMKGIAAWVLIGTGILTTLFTLLYVIHMFSISGTILSSVGEAKDYLREGGLSNSDIRDQYPHYFGMRSIVWAERFRSLAYMLVLGLAPLMFGIKKFLKTRALDI
ncbi:MAG: hypothetical protein FWB72_01520 [Firmicutes bacterium]|nr:hypothetical protein [Bacillota bacterium]